MSVPYLPAHCDACHLAHLVLARLEGPRCGACKGPLRVTGLQELDANQLRAFAELARALQSAGLGAGQCHILLGALALVDDDEQALRAELLALSRVVPAVSLARVAARGDAAAMGAMLRLAMEVLRARASVWP